MSDKPPGLRDAFEAFVEAAARSKAAADQMRAAKAAFDESLVSRSRALQGLSIARRTFDDAIVEFVGMDAVEGDG